MEWAKKEKRKKPRIFFCAMRSLYRPAAVVKYSGHVCSHTTPAENCPVFHNTLCPRVFCTLLFSRRRRRHRRRSTSDRGANALLCYSRRADNNTIFIRQDFFFPHPSCPSRPFPTKFFYFFSLPVISFIRITRHAASTQA